MTNSTGSAAHVAGLMPGDASNTLANEDLLPTTAAQRHWTWKDFAALWVGMVVCVPTYTGQLHAGPGLYLADGRVAGVPGQLHRAGAHGAHRARRAPVRLSLIHI